MSVILISQPIRAEQLRNATQAAQTREIIEWCTKRGKVVRARIIGGPRWDLDPGAPGYVVDVELVDAETIIDVFEDARAARS